MNRFKLGMERLIATFLANAKVDIVYHRVEAGVDTPVTTTAWVGETLFKILEKDNQRMEWGDRDFLIPVPHLAVGGVLFLPAKGHWIEEVLPAPAGTRQYELSAPENEPVWRWSDPQHLLYRVHTKRVVS